VICMYVTGYLEKRGAMVKSWKRRFFKIDDSRNAVCYYEVMHQHVTFISSPHHPKVLTITAWQRPMIVIKWQPIIKRANVIGRDFSYNINK
jgi:hypothetical protein